MDILERKLESNIKIKYLLTEESYLQDIDEYQETKLFGLFKFKNRRIANCDVSSLTNNNKVKQVGFTK